MSNPCVSVIIPTYKRDWNYLGRAINSILRQTFSDFEVIVIDDSPSDYPLREDIMRNMKALQAEDVRIKYLINEKNMGGSLSRNRGIDCACGKYVTFLDDDDEYLPEKLAHQVEFMEKEGCDLSFENMVMYNNKGVVVDVREYKDLKSTDNDYLLKYHLMRHMTGTPTFMFKTEKLREIGGFTDAKMGQEFLLMLKAIQNGLSILYFPVNDIKVYKHADGGITQGKNKINGENALYHHKKQFFDKLTIRERMFVRFRHYAVMVVAYLRNKMYLAAAGAAICAFFVSPLDFFLQVTGFFVRVIKNRMGK